MYIGPVVPGFIHIYIYIERERERERQTEGEGEGGGGGPHRPSARDPKVKHFQLQPNHFKCADPGRLGQYGPSAPVHIYIYIYSSVPGFKYIYIYISLQ